MSNELIKKWLIAQIKPNSYDLAVRNLERQGLETFLPKIETTIKKGNKFFNKNIFVFPGYIFIGVDLQNFNWTKINSTYGVLRVLVFNDKPSEISHCLILALKNRYKANTDPTLKENVDNGKRIWVLLEVMGGNQKLKLQQKKNLKYSKV